MLDTQGLIHVCFLRGVLQDCFGIFSALGVRRISSEDGNQTPSPSTSLSYTLGSQNTPPVPQDCIDVVELPCIMHYFR